MAEVEPSPVVPYGTWPSPITPAVVTAAAVSLGGPRCDGEDLWWSELRPAEQGRVQLVRKPLEGAPASAVDVLGGDASARTRVHEYGGGAWWVEDGLVLFTDWDDQRLWVLEPDGDEPARPITPAPVVAAGDRYADLRCRTAADGTSWVLAVRERHGPAGGEPVNELVAVRVVEPGEDPAEPVVLVTGPDFVSHPRPSPDGAHLCWLQWDHPQMPWDGTELWAADLVDGAAGPALVAPRRVAGGVDESIAQPEWDRTGRLHLVSDRPVVPSGADAVGADGWWGLYRCAAIGLPDDGAPLEAVLVVPGAELAQPQWVFGQSWYAWSPAGDLVACCRRDGRDRLLVVPGGGPATEAVTILDEVTAVDGVIGTTRGVACLAAGFATEASVLELLEPGDAARRGVDPAVVVHRPPRDLDIDPIWWSAPEHVEVAGPGGAVRALVYPPTNPSVTAPAGTAPPLLVLIHGGPTSAARPLLSLAVQFWTSRGFCVADVNYRGSTGYGRAYRRALDGAWGVADTEDCVAVAAALAERGVVDPGHLAIRGGSAGGFTVLGALLAGSAPDAPARFGAGACLYAVTDLEALVHDTHKFEAHYTDTLVGPWPEAADVYRERSPIHHLDDLRTPIIVFQGLEDAVVPPAQAEALVAAADAHGVPHAYLTFPGEQHGFRRAATIERVLQAELYFYGRVLGLVGGDTAEAVGTPPVEIRHLG